MTGMVVVVAVGGITENVMEIMVVMAVIADHDRTSRYGKPGGSD